MNRYLWDIDNEKGYNNKMGRYKTQIEFNFLQEHIKGNKLKILDVGGGSGRFAIELENRDHYVRLIDPDEEAIKLAKSKGIKNASCMLIEELVEQDFDVIIAIEVLGWIKDVDFFFENVSNKLRKGGTVIFTITNIDSWRYKIKRKIRKGTTYNHLTLNKYRELAQKNDLDFKNVLGFMWLPFKVNSNSFLIPFFILIERLFQLKKYTYQSPWLIVKAQKK
jgi:2-polyprenyl-3-methyl-5-hydroxy-6-metoxy-1,4-benzoquinol methylase